MDITEKEKELKKWLLTNKSIKQIAREMKVSENTIKTFRNSLYKKLQISSREDLMADVINRQRLIINVLKNLY